MLFMYLCEVAVVSQLCIFPLYLLHGLCEDYLTCDIAFNAVMPLSRASTRGRYSRIEGVTGLDEQFPVGVDEQDPVVLPLDEQDPYRASRLGLDEQDHPMESWMNRTTP